MTGARLSLTAGRVDGIVIGTSAGGVEALSILLPALPEGLRAAVFIVLHLPRERPSLLVDIFQPKCAVPVREAQDKEPVDRGTVYFAPPDYHLLVDDGPQLALSADELVHYSRPSIDVLFESAADVVSASAARHHPDRRERGWRGGTGSGASRRWHRPSCSIPKPPTRRSW